MPYIFQYRYTDDDFIALNRIYQKTRMRFLYYIGRIAKALAFCTGLFCLLPSIVLVVSGYIEPGTVLLLAISLFLVVFPFLNVTDKLSGKLSRKATLQGDDRVCVQLDEKHIRDIVGDTKKVYPYRALLDCYRHGDRYFLFVEQNKAIILPRRGLQDGDFEEIPAWIEGKTGKPITVLKKI